MIRKSFIKVKTLKQANDYYKRKGVELIDLEAHNRRLMIVGMGFYYATIGGYSKGWGGYAMSRQWLIENGYQDDSFIVYADEIYKYI